MVTVFAAGVSFSPSLLNAFSLIKVSELQVSIRLSIRWVVWLLP